MNKDLVEAEKFLDEEFSKLKKELLETVPQDLPTFKNNIVYWLQYVREKFKSINSDEIVEATHYKEG